MLLIVARSVLLLFFGFALFLTAGLSLIEAIARRHGAQPIAGAGFFQNAASLVRDDSSISELRAAVDADPRLSPAWIRLGLSSENDGNLSEAEEDLLEAARVDHQYVPAWTLANFYFRRDDSRSFWPWAQKATVLTFDDYRPLLRLADALEVSPREAMAHLQGNEPPVPLARAYLDLLIGQGRLDAAQEVAHVLAARHDPSDRARLADLAARRRRAGSP